MKDKLCNMPWQWVYEGLNNKNKCLHEFHIGQSKLINWLNSSFLIKSTVIKINIYLIIHFNTLNWSEIDKWYKKFIPYPRQFIIG